MLLTQTEIDTYREIGKMLSQAASAYEVAEWSCDTDDERVALLRKAAALVHKAWGISMHSLEMPAERRTLGLEPFPSDDST